MPPGKDPVLLVWDAAAGKPIKKVGHYDWYVPFLTFAPDGKTLTASWAHAKPAWIWRTDTWEVAHKLEGSPSGVRHLAYARDGKTLATAELDNRIRIWDVATGKLLTELASRGKIVSRVAFSPDGKMLAAADGNGHKRIDIWELESKNIIKTLDTDDGSAFFIAFSHDGKTLVAATKTIQSFDIATGKVQQLINPAKVNYAFLETVAISRDGKLLLTGGTNPTAHLWDITTGEMVAAFGPHDGIIVNVALSPDGSLALIRSQSLWLWKVPKK
jgi:WD40 repeat protein